MTDAQLDAAASEAARVESEIRRHLSVDDGAFEQARGWVAYRGAVALRKGLEEWIATRARRAQSHHVAGE